MTVALQEDFIQTSIIIGIFIVELLDSQLFHCSAPFGL